MLSKMFSIEDNKFFCISQKTKVENTSTKKSYFTSTLYNSYTKLACHPHTYTSCTFTAKTELAMLLAGKKEKKTLPETQPYEETKAH